jgi:formylglycine-generating enzyme required for sulfatase activity
LTNNISLAAVTSEALRHQFISTWELYEKLFSVLQTKAFFYRAERLRHHLIFYYGHTAVFYLNKLVAGGFLGRGERINAKFESVFSVGVDEMSWDDILEENYEWCGLSDAELEKYLQNVQNYRDQVKQLVLRLIDANPIGARAAAEEEREGKSDGNAAGISVSGLEEVLTAAAAGADKEADQRANSKDSRKGSNASLDSARSVISLGGSTTGDSSANKISQADIHWILLMGIEHEKIHLETSAVIISQVPLNMLKPEGEHRWNYPVHQDISAQFPGDNPHAPPGVMNMSPLHKTASAATVASTTTGEPSSDQSESLSPGSRGSFAKTETDSGGLSPGLSPEQIKMKYDGGGDSGGPISVRAADGVKLTSTSLAPTSLAVANKLVSIPGGKVAYGKSHLEADLYGWDNEFGSEVRDLRPFEVSQTLVSNAEFMKFVDAGGYKDEKWWSKEGWRFVMDLQVECPRFWVAESSDSNTTTQSLSAKYTKYRTMLEEIPMPYNWPVECNNLEAEAFCNWLGTTDEGYKKENKKLRLISHEEQFHLRRSARNVTANTNINPFAGPAPVDMFSGEIANTSDSDTNGNTNGKNTRVFDVYGNVWRHSCSVLTVLDGFKTHPVYDDFTLPTIDGEHNHIVGGSWISFGNCANPNARYGFRRHFYQYAGIRYVCSDNEYHKDVAKIYDGPVIGKQISEHYTQFEEQTLITEVEKPVKNWPQLFGRIAAKYVNEWQKEKNIKASTKLLVAHGGVGRSTLEILRNCDKVTIDHTDPTANTMQVLDALLQKGRVQWYQQIEGMISELRDYALSSRENSATLLENRGNSVSYHQCGDQYKNMRPHLNGYGVVVADIRYKEAGDAIAHLLTKLQPGGILVLGSIDEPEVAMNAALEVNAQRGSVDFEMQAIKLSTEDFGDENRFGHVFHETVNKHQFAVSYCSVWRKKGEEKGENSKVNASSKQPSPKSSVPASPTAVVQQSTAQYYEDNDILVSYDRFHFHKGLLGVQNFPERMAQVCLEACKKYGVTNLQRAMDAGCGPGRTALELCREFGVVEAFDYSQSFTDMMVLKRAEMMSGAEDEANGERKCYLNHGHPPNKNCHD